MTLRKTVAVTKKATKGTFERSLEAIFNDKTTNELIALFDKKREEFMDAHPSCDEMIRFKELTILKTLRMCLKGRGKSVEIYA